MKNASISTLFIVFLGLLCHFFLPWWSLAIIAALAGILFHHTAAAAFGAGFVAGSLLWYGSAFYHNSLDMGVFSAKMGEILHLKGWQLLSATGTIGGLIAGFGAMTGVLGKHILQNEDNYQSTRYPKRRRTSGVPTGKTFKF
jgi:hypothetical protein